MKSNEMKTESTDASKQKAARVAGFMFLCCILIPSLNWFFILAKFIESESVVTTAHNILADKFIFRIGIINEVITTVVIVLLSLTLYEILKLINKNLALFALILNLINAFLTVVIALWHLIALQILSSLASLTAINQELVKSLVGLFLNIHISLTSIPGMFLGLSMSMFLYLLFKSKYIPSVLAGFGLISFVLIFIYDVLFFLLPTFSSILIVQIVGWVPNVLFMLIIGVWLLIKRLNIQKI
jgi:hypothetical protein